MEPAAPGTEDDDLVDFNSLNKKEAENDRLLSIKAVLKHGRYENVFELSFVNGAERWYCKVCECPVMGRVYQHELGRRHSINMAATYRPSKGKEPPDETKNITEEDALDQMEVAPGEPVPPGFEEEIARKPQIQDRLDNFKVGPLVALEYLIEMADYDPSKEPTYLCILCDKKGDPRTVLTHLASYNHISQYLQKHFPICYRALAPYMTKQYKRNWQVVLQKIAEAIEKKFGRLRPFCIDKDRFDKDRMQYLTMIFKGKHFSEQSGPTFVELVVHDELTKSYDDEGVPLKPSTASFGAKSYIEKEPSKPKESQSKRSPSPPVVNRPVKKVRTPVEEKKYVGNANISRVRQRSLSSVSSLSSDDETPKGFREISRNRSPPTKKFIPFNKRSQDNRINRSPFTRHSPSPRRSPLPRRRFNRETEEERRKNREKDRLQKLEEFSKLSKAIENDIQKTLKQYEKNPEKHPKYNEEWKLFWNKRYKELQSQGKDASKHDFKPEWIQFWGKRMKELSDEDLKSRKDGLRKRLGLSEEPQPIRFRIGGGPIGPKSSEPKEKKLNLPMAARPDNDPEVIIISDKPEPSYKSSQKDVIVIRDRDRSHSPWESDSSPPRAQEKAKALSPSPPSDRRRGRPKVESRDRSFDRRRSPERRRSRERNRPSIERGRRSPDRYKRSPETSRNSRDRKSRSPDSYKSGRNYARERERDYYRDDLDRNSSGRFPSRERSWDRGLRESSFERDLRTKDRIRTAPEAPWEREKSSRMYMHGSHPFDRPPHIPPHMMSHDFYGPPPIMRDARPGLSYGPPPVIDDEPDDGEVNIVSVLRLLTALEDRLGSLGPKIIDLLAQALALEKKEANSSDTLLDNEINCVMFETVKEKLKGQLLAGLVDPVQERAFKKAIQKTANLIHMGSQRKKERAPADETAVAVPGIGAVDKAAIAKQLANALIAQGKTDVTQAELEQLINAVVGMAEASKKSNKRLTAANLLSQLTGEPAKIIAEQNEKIITPRVSKSSGEDSFDKSKGKEALTSLESLTEPLSPDTPERSTAGNMENLSDSDLQTLLQNFKDLSTEEQMNLINYLKKLELDEPDRVERLRKFVNLGADQTSKDVIDLDREPSPDRGGRKSPFSRRIEEDNLEGDGYEKKKHEETKVKLHLDSEDEDYSFEDVVKAASKKVKEKEMEDNRKIVKDSIAYSNEQKETNLMNAKTLISNLMGSLNNTIVSTSSVSLLGLPASSVSSAPQSSTVTTSSADFAKAISNINMDSIASIVSNVQRASQDKRVNFEPPNNSSFFNNRFNESNQLSNSTLGKPLEHQSQNELGGMKFEPPRNIQVSNSGFTFEHPGPMPPMNQGPIRLNLLGHQGGEGAGPHNVGPNGANTPMGRNIGPRGAHMSYGHTGNNPNQFGNSRFMNQRMQRPQFTPNFNNNSNFNNNPRYGGPRGPGFNNRW